MRKKNKLIPVNTMDYIRGQGIAIERITIGDLSAYDKANSDFFEHAKQPHREDRHSFFLLESGTVDLEIDFQKYEVEPGTIIYMHPDQVHRILTFENVTVCSWAINNESLNPEYLKLLEGITPVKPLVLKQNAYSLISEALSLCIRFYEQESNKLYHSLLKDSCNALIALVIAQFLEKPESTGKLLRPEIVTKAFRELLESHYATIRRPAAFAQLLHLSTPYLNECVRKTTGHPVSYHIQQRVMLEAKRLLYHSDKSVKEIAAELGYDDYPYFSRLFTKANGISALAFRAKNFD